VSCMDSRSRAPIKGVISGVAQETKAEDLSGGQRKEVHFIHATAL
jgi:hypothetical protein